MNFLDTMLVRVIESTEIVVLMHILSQRSILDERDYTSYPFDVASLSILVVYSSISLSSLCLKSDVDLRATDPPYLDCFVWVFDDPGGGPGLADVLKAHALRSVILGSFVDACDPSPLPGRRGEEPEVIAKLDFLGFDDLLDH